MHATTASVTTRVRDVYSGLELTLLLRVLQDVDPLGEVAMPRGVWRAGVPESWTLDARLHAEQKKPTREKTT